MNPATIQNDELMNDEDDALFLQEEVLASVKEHEERQSTSAQQQVQPSDIETTNVNIPV